MDPEELRAHLKKGLIIAVFFAVALAFFLLRWKTALIAYVVAVGVLAVLAILLQSGRGGGLAASLGGMGADSLLGTHSATPIAKATYVMLALTLFVLILIARMGYEERRVEGILPLREPAVPATSTVPVTPAVPATPAAPAEVPASSEPAPGGAASND